MQPATRYILALNDVGAQLSTHTRDELDDIVEDAEREFLIYLVVLGVFVLGCLVLAIWYVYFIFSADFQGKHVGWSKPYLKIGTVNIYKCTLNNSYLAGFLLWSLFLLFSYLLFYLGR